MPLPDNSSEAILASRRGHRIMHRGRKLAAPAVKAKQGEVTAARLRNSSEVL
jgi:hypothetical protein